MICKKKIFVFFEKRSKENAIIKAIPTTIILGSTLILIKTKNPSINPIHIEINSALREANDIDFTDKTYFCETDKALPKMTINFPGMYFAKIDSPSEIIASRKEILTFVSYFKTTFHVLHMTIKPMNNKRIDSKR